MATKTARKVTRTAGKGKPKRPGLKGKRGQAGSPPVPFTAEHRNMLAVLIDDHVVRANRQANPRPPIPFAQYAEGLDLLGSLIDDREADNCDTSSLAMFIHNKGSAEDRAEGLLAILPVARRLYDRMT